MQIVIDIHEKDYKSMKNGHIPYSVLSAIMNGTPLPDNPTNGDMIKAMFPDAKVNNTKYSCVVEVKLPYHSKYDTGLLFDKDWWNAPYKKESD